MTDNVELMRKDALGHFADASQWDMAPEDTINWQRGLNANNAANEIETLRSELERLRGALLTGASLLEQGCNATDMAGSMRRAATGPKERTK